MKLLALDTSTQYCSVALLLGDSLTEKSVLAGQRHSEFLIPMVRELMDAASVKLKELDGIAFGAGPGSFTGLRIACGVTQGFAFGAGLRVAAVPTLLALAQASDQPKVIAALDARMGEVYHAAYERSGGHWRTVSPPALLSPSEVPLVAGAEWVGVGSGFAVHAEVLARRYAGRLAAIKPDIYPTASAIARLAVEMFRRGEVTDATEATPLYLRDKVAFTEQERRAMR